MKVKYEEDNDMTVPRGHRFPIEFADAFPRGIVLRGEIAPDNEYQSYVFRATGFEAAGSSGGTCTTGKASDATTQAA